MGHVLRVSERRVRALWADLTLTQAEIASALGCTKKGLWGLAKRLDLPPRPAVHKRAVDVAAIRAQCEAGLSPMQIARLLGLKHRTVKSVIERHGLRRNGRAVAHAPLMADDRFRSMWAARVRLADMAAAYGVSVMSIRSAARRDGLPARGCAKGFTITMEAWQQDRLREAMAASAQIERKALRLANMVDVVSSPAAVAAVQAARVKRELGRVA